MSNLVDNLNNIKAAKVPEIWEPFKEAVLYLNEDDIDSRKENFEDYIKDNYGEDGVDKIKDAFGSTKLSEVDVINYFAENIIDSQEDDDDDDDLEMEMIKIKKKKILVLERERLRLNN